MTIGGNNSNNYYSSSADAFWLSSSYDSSCTVDALSGSDITWTSVPYVFSGGSTTGIQIDGDLMVNGTISFGDKRQQTKQFTLEYEFLNSLDRQTIEPLLLEEIYQDRNLENAYKFYTPIDWDDYEEELRELSQRFPTVVLKLSMHNGSPYSWKRLYFCAGCMQEAEARIFFDDFDPKKLDDKAPPLDDEEED